MNVTAAVVYLGWPYLIGMAMTKNSDGWRRARLKASFALPYMLLFHILAGLVLMNGLAALSGLQKSFFLLGWLGAMVSTFYLLWFGASALVAAESRGQIRLEKCVGTLVEFLVLPIGVLFLQGRVRRALARTG